VECHYRWDFEGFLDPQTKLLPAIRGLTSPRRYSPYEHTKRWISNTLRRNWYSEYLSKPVVKHQESTVYAALSAEDAVGNDESFTTEARKVTRRPSR
jgi:hypothetical protein